MEAITPLQFRHFEHGYGYFIGCYFDADRETSPDWTLPVYEFDDDFHPFPSVERALNAIEQRDEVTLDSCLVSNDSRSGNIMLDLDKTKSVLRSIILSDINRYLAIPQSDGLIIFDLWMTKIKNQEPCFRLYLLRNEEKGAWFICRAMKMVSTSVRVDTTGIEQCISETYSDATENEDYDTYSDVESGSAFEFFLQILSYVRLGDAERFGECLDKLDRRNSWLAITLFRTLKRVVAFEETRSGCIGVSEKGILVFDKYHLDITAQSFDLELFDWQFDLKWDNGKFLLCGFEDYDKGARDA